jgi:hypothetical protein
MEATVRPGLHVFHNIRSDSMLNITSNDVKNWLADNIGETLFSRRKYAFNYNSKKIG